jgi:hypothetical protein
LGPIKSEARIFKMGQKATHESQFLANFAISIFCIEISAKPASKRLLVSGCFSQRYMKKVNTCYYPCMSIALLARKDKKGGGKQCLPPPHSSPASGVLRYSLSICWGQPTPKKL